MTPRLSAFRAARLTLVAAALASVTLLQGCAGLVIGAAASTGLAVVDRRTVGTQVDDTNIELKAAARARDLLGDRAHLNFTSYNRLLLITGEVREAADKARIDQAFSNFENVKSVINDVEVTMLSSLGSRTNDTLISGKVKARFVDDGNLNATAVKVVTERGIVYLMGLVTEREAARAVQLTQAVSGVTKVVKVFEVLSEEELNRLRARNDGTR